MVYKAVAEGSNPRYITAALGEDGSGVDGRAPAVPLAEHPLLGAGDSAQPPAGVAGMAEVGGADATPLQGDTACVRGGGYPAGRHGAGHQLGEHSPPPAPSATFNSVQVVINDTTHSVMLTNGLLGGVSPKVSCALIVVNQVLSTSYLVLLPMQFLCRLHFLPRIDSPTAHRQSLALYLAKYLLPCAVVVPLSLWAFFISAQPVTMENEGVARAVLEKSGWLSALRQDTSPLLLDKRDSLLNACYGGLLAVTLYVYTLILVTEWRITTRVRAMSRVSAAARCAERGVQRAMLAYAAEPFGQTLLTMVGPVLVGALPGAEGAAPYLPLLYLFFQAGLAVNPVLTVLFVKPYRLVVIGWVAAALRCRGRRASGGCGNSVRVVPAETSDEGARRSGER